MYTVLLVIHLIITISLIAVVLLQKSETAGFGAASSGGGMLSVRGQANLLTRMTAILAASFFITSITLAIMARKTHDSKSLFDVQAPVIPVPKA